MNINNDPCFEDKSSYLTLKYRPVHFPNKAVLQAVSYCKRFIRLYVLDSMQQLFSTFNVHFPMGTGYMKQALCFAVNELVSTHNIKGDLKIGEL